MNFDPGAVLSSLEAMLGLGGGEGRGGGAGGGDGEEGSSDDGDSDGVESEGEEEMKALMEEMDRELAGTAISKSFETTAVSLSPFPPFNALPLFCLPQSVAIFFIIQ